MAVPEERTLGWMLRSRGVEPHKEFLAGILEVRAMRLYSGPFVRGSPGQFRQSQCMADRWRGSVPPGFDYACRAARIEWLVMTPLVVREDFIACRLFEDTRL